MNNLIHCDMCGYLMTKRWSETISPCPQGVWQ